MLFHTDSSEGKGFIVLAGDDSKDIVISKTIAVFYSVFSQMFFFSKVFSGLISSIQRVLFAAFEFNLYNCSSTHHYRPHNYNKYDLVITWVKKWQHNRSITTGAQLIMIWWTIAITTSPIIEDLFFLSEWEFTRHLKIRSIPNSSFASSVEHFKWTFLHSWPARVPVLHEHLKSFSHVLSIFF